MEALIVLGVVLGYLCLGLVTARAAWLVRHRTLATTSQTIGIVLGWPLVVLGFVATLVADGLHDLVTKPTRQEQLEDRRARLRVEIDQLEQELGLARDEERP